MKTVVHVTHEAVQKIGGIGAVLHGLITSKTYRADVGRDILLGPLFSTDGPMDGRLHGGTVLYSGVDGYRNTPYANDFARIEHEYGVKIIYGKKKFHDPLTGITSEPEAILIDVRHYHPDKMGIFKYILFEDYKIESQKYEHIWDYEQYCRIAEPGLEAIRALGVCSNGSVPIIISHEYMGMPMQRGLGPHIRGTTENIRGLGSFANPSVFGHGGVGILGKSNVNYVWPVRGGQ